MLVKELIEALKKFDPEMEVTISDGYELNFYRGSAEGDFFIQKSEVYPNAVDIGVGGCLETEDEDYVDDVEGSTWSSKVL